MAGRTIALACVLAAGGGLAAGCGAGARHRSAAGSPPALSAEAQSAATGDIPDNQVFLRFRDPGGGYSILYPEGWARRGRAGDVTFQDKNNLVRILVVSGPAPTPARVRDEIVRERARDHTLRAGSPRPVRIGGAPAIKVVYSTVSAPNPVTEKRVQLVVDRYVLGRNGRTATVDLGTPKGVDNVDAYRMMIESFRWE